MRLTALLPAFLASTLVAASPEIETILDSLVEDEAHIYKQDAAISARDIELAERHDIDLNESTFVFACQCPHEINNEPVVYKHSIIKRDDGDHITIWVAKSFNERDEEAEEDVKEEVEDDDDSDAALEKRQRVNIWNTDRYTSSSGTDAYCQSSTYIDDTGPNAPFTGGANAIINWGNSCNGGFWRLNGLSQGQNLNLVVAGSNSGYNMRFTLGMRHTLNAVTTARIGCRDVGIITRSARVGFQQNINGGWRVRARGGVVCRFQTIVCVPTCIGGPMEFSWWIDRSSATVT